MSLLAVRLSAFTVDENAVFRTWPALCDLAWPGQGEVEGGSWRPKHSPAALNAPVAVAPVPRGVRELADALSEQAHFGGWPEQLKSDLAPALSRMENARTDLENALADWEPQSAVKAATALEDALGDMQDILS